ncbi:hypothetical protein N7465_011196 [Penicillium sp. CMV-2018d]|nr:hypothetical protein N7465_011196 [Penicillium sp. CMV-2018d]
MAPPEKKGKEPMKTVRQSKVKRAMGQRATQKRTFTKNEIFLEFIKNQEGLVQSNQPEREKTPSNQEGPKNATRMMIPL